MVFNTLFPHKFCDMRMCTVFKLIQACIRMDRLLTWTWMCIYTWFSISSMHIIGDLLLLLLFCGLVFVRSFIRNQQCMILVVYASCVYYIRSPFECIAFAKLFHTVSDGWLGYMPLSFVYYIATAWWEKPWRGHVLNKVFCNKLLSIVFFPTSS